LRVGRRYCKADHEQRAKNCREESGFTHHNAPLSGLLISTF
jgi:hypothetical protein